MTRADFDFMVRVSPLALLVLVVLWLFVVWGLTL